jgi:hypothetical protein
VRVLGQKFRVSRVGRNARVVACLAQIIWELLPFFPPIGILQVSCSPMEQILERLHAFGEFEVWLGNRPFCWSSRDFFWSVLHC